MALISSNTYLSMENAMDNAQYIYNFMIRNGASQNAALAVLGNMYAESTCNPGIWQNLDSSRTDLGFGLVQWTPSTKYTNWAAAKGYESKNINGQLQRILYEKNVGIQWQKRTTSMSFAEFWNSGESLETLVELFELNYEQHAGAVQPKRKEYANYWKAHLALDDDSIEKIEKAIAWMLNIAADNSHGYDQGYRWGPDYDCSSFCITAWQEAGVPVKTYGASYTGDMRAVFLRCGFSDVIGSVDVYSGSGLKRGDVLLSEGYHVATYIGNGQIVHASQNEFGGAVGGQTGDQTGTEICTRGYYSHTPPWDHVLRYKQGGTEETPTPEQTVTVYPVQWIPA